MSDENSPGATDGSLDLFCRVGVVRLNNASSEEVVDLLVHTRVHHDISVGIDDLEYRAGLDARFVRSTFHGKIFGAAAFRKLQDIDAQRRLARDHAGCVPYLIDACRPNLIFLRIYKEKPEHGKMKYFFHRLLPRTRLPLPRSALLCNRTRKRSLDSCSCRLRSSAHDPASSCRRNPLPYRRASPSTYRHRRRR